MPGPGGRGRAACAPPARLPARCIVHPRGSPAASSPAQSARSPPSCKGGAPARPRRDAGACGPLRCAPGGEAGLRGSCVPHGPGKCRVASRLRSGNEIPWVLGARAAPARARSLPRRAHRGEAGAPPRPLPTPTPHPDRSVATLAGLGLVWKHLQGGVEVRSLWTGPRIQNRARSSFRVKPFCGELVFRCLRCLRPGMRLKLRDPPPAPPPHTHTPTHTHKFSQPTTPYLRNST